MKPAQVSTLMAYISQAKATHGPFPTDIVRGVAIVVEEAGEAVQAALNCTRPVKGVMTITARGIGDLRKELYQTACAAMEMVEMLDAGGWATVVAPPLKEDKPIDAIGDIGCSHADIKR